MITALVFLSQSNGVHSNDDFSMEILSNHLANGDKEHRRSRSKWHPGYEMNCCGDQPKEEDKKEMIEECFQSIFKSGWPKSQEDKLNARWCLAKCIAKKRNLANDDEIVDKANFVEEYKKFDPDTWRQEQMEKSYEICIEASKKFTIKIAEKQKNISFVCDPQTSGFFRCQMREILLNCPNDKFKANNQFCTKLREKLEKEQEDM
ncbi:general odorant-binding protein 66-like [Chrysoperla carnea]|uniref:general odorant-binding protein 66-like n=1 Tax=Chrysoperla carnea TaxID=189513 RepID=UPI001D0965B0|nr:general odorant-binding protein 66-like [Chrysoperla carnea]